MTCVQVKIGSFCCDLPNLKEEMDVVFSKKGIMFTLPPTPSQNRKKLVDYEMIWFVICVRMLCFRVAITSCLYSDGRCFVH